MLVFDSNVLGRLSELIGPGEARALLGELRAEIPLLRDAARARHADADHAGLGRVVHKLASASGVLGFPLLADACREVERCCRSGETGALPPLWTAFETACDTTLAAIDTELGTH